jgi:hypothetical protein
LCCILLPLQSYMVCMLSSQVLPLNSSTLLSVPDDWRVNASCTMVLLLVWHASCRLFHKYYAFYIDFPSLQTFMPYPYLSDLHTLSSMQPILLHDTIQCECGHGPRHETVGHVRHD